LEYCKKENVISREQYYFDFLNPEYNILKIAGSSLGYKHSLETRLKFKTRDLGTGHITFVIDKEYNYTKVYISVRAAARDLRTSHQSLLNYINTNKLFKCKYFIYR
jgi:hypothetical protein